MFVFVFMCEYRLPSLWPLHYISVTGRSRQKKLVCPVCQMQGLLVMLFLMRLSKCLAYARALLCGWRLWNDFCYDRMHSVCREVFVLEVLKPLCCLCLDIQMWGTALDRACQVGRGQVQWKASFSGYADAVLLHKEWGPGPVQFWVRALEGVEDKRAPATEVFRLLHVLTDSRFFSSVPVYTRGEWKLISQFLCLKKNESEKWAWI